MKVLSAIGVMKGDSFNGGQFYHVVGEDENKEQFCIGFACVVRRCVSVAVEFGLHPAWHHNRRYLWVSLV